MFTQKLRNNGLLPAVAEKRCPFLALGRSSNIFSWGEETAYQSLKDIDAWLNT
ncbi:MAG: hypothetical protein ACI9R3_004153 [Verrucomicrobiales bacterium]|jgi:hypothetical protein